MKTYDTTSLLSGSRLICGLTPHPRAYPVELTVGILARFKAAFKSRSIEWTRADGMGNRLPICCLELGLGHFDDHGVPHLPAPTNPSHRVKAYLTKLKNAVSNKPSTFKAISETSFLTGFSKTTIPEIIVLKSAVTEC